MGNEEECGIHVDFVQESPCTFKLQGYCCLRQEAKNAVRSDPLSAMSLPFLETNVEHAHLVCLTSAPSVFLSSFPYHRGQQRLKSFLYLCKFWLGELRILWTFNQATPSRSLCYNIQHSIVHWHLPDLLYQKIRSFKVTDHLPKTK
ncbi:hypothetical protein LENED_012131 [Lentinula edodes]|uniref:Uncharacterized protein n=1 Tax=Lentinula edodes TaxID=5353 RepID=A0A1Q3ERT4_LENED|nr:hypothetical protein LENED_012131 [Lentinula edodes]